MHNYIDLHRHAAVRAAMLDHPAVALRLVVAHAITGSGLWQVRPEPQRAANETVTASLAGCKAEAAFGKKRREVLALLGSPDEDSLVAGGNGDAVAIAGVFARLLALCDDDVMRVLTLVMAETLAAGSAVVEALGNHLNVDMGIWWQPDDAFFDLLRDKEIANSMLADVGGKLVADGNVAEKVKTQKNIIRDFLAGENGRPWVETWLPRWMKFPAESYTSRSGSAPPISGHKCSRCSCANSRSGPERRFSRLPPLRSRAPLRATPAADWASCRASAAREKFRRQFAPFRQPRTAPGCLLRRQRPMGPIVRSGCRQSPRSRRSALRPASCVTDRATCLHCVSGTIPCGWLVDLWADQARPKPSPAAFFPAVRRLPRAASLQKSCPRGSSAIAAAVPVPAVRTRPSRSAIAGEWSLASTKRRLEMTAIGYVTKQENGGYKGQLKTLSVRADIDIVPNQAKSADTHPDFRVLTQGVEVGAGWIRTGETSGKDYVSLSIAAPEFGPRKLYANLGRAAGQDDDDTYAIIWNPVD